MYKLRGREKKGGRGLVGKALKSMVPFVVDTVPTAINRAVDVLPVELHLPGYRFCGPGTKLEERLARGERGINQLDEACREHDIAYAKYKDNEHRQAADRVLAGKAWERVTALNSGVSERAYAAAVATAMEAKSTIGGGLCCKRKRRSGKTTKLKKTKKKNTNRNKTTANGSGVGPARKRTTKPVSYTHLDVYKRQQR